MQNFTTTKNLIIAVRPFNTVANPVSPSADEYNPVLPNNLHDPAQNDRKWQPMEKQQIFKVNLKWLQLNDRWKEETSTASSYKHCCRQEKFNYLNQKFRYRIGQRIRKQNSENKIQRRNEDFKNLNLLKTVWLIIITHDVNHIPWLYFSSLSLFTLINVQFLALIHQ